MRRSLRASFMEHLGSLTHSGWAHIICAESKPLPMPDVLNKINVPTARLVFSHTFALGRASNPFLRAEWVCELFARFVSTLHAHAKFCGRLLCRCRLRAIFAGAVRKIRTNADQREHLAFCEPAAAKYHTRAEDIYYVIWVWQQSNELCRRLCARAIMAVFCTLHVDSNTKH